MSNLTSKEEYWLESFSCIWEEEGPEGVELSSDQLIQIAKSLAGSAEVESQYFGYDCIPNPGITRAEKAERELKIERSKIHCRECNGTGRITMHGPSHSSNSGCWKCHGEGKYTP